MLRPKSRLWGGARMSINQIQPQIVQLLVMTFFITSFASFYSSYWHRLATQPATNPSSPVWRILLSLGIEGLGIVLFITASMVGPTNAVIYTNGALILLSSVLFDTNTTWPEYMVRVAGILLVWIAAHWDNLTSPLVMTMTVVMLGLLSVIRAQSRTTRANLALNMTMSALADFAFWMTLPATTLLGLDGTGLSLTIAIGMFLIMASVLNIYWVYRHHAMTKAAQITNNVLTTAATYERYEHHMTDMFNTAQESAGTFTMAVMDIDHFAQVNTQCGHMGGNGLLLDLTHLLEETLRQYADSVEILRTGGQEFTVAVKNADGQAALPIIVACWQAVRTHHFYYKGGQVNLTVSVGMTSMHPRDESVEDTYQRATTNLQQSKHSGRDVITLDGQVYGQHHQAHHAELAYFGQGIYDVNADNPRLVHNELLLRQYDASHHRWVLPQSFEISVGTQINLLRHFLRHSQCKSVTLNLTAQEFRDATVATALTLFKQRADGPEELIVEIMDTPSLQYVREISSIYHAGGVKIYIDDVGSDNSFELVHTLFPYVDGVKFAMQNLRKTATFEQMAERIKFWTGIAQEYHLEFILEGVETQYEMAFDRTNFGIMLEQGYYFGRPAPAEKAVA